MGFGLIVELSGRFQLYGGSEVVVQPLVLHWRVAGYLSQYRFQSNDPS